MKNKSLKPFKFAVASFLENFPQFFTADSLSYQDFLEMLELIQRTLSDILYRAEKYFEDGESCE